MTTFDEAVRESGDDWYYATDPVPGAPGWEITRTNRRTHVDVGCNPARINNHRVTSIEDIEIDRERADFCITVDAPYEGTSGSRIPVAVIAEMLRAAGWTVVPPT